MSNRSWSSLSFGLEIQVRVLHLSLEHDLEKEIGIETVSFTCVTCNKDITSDEMTTAVSCLQCTCSCHSAVAMAAHFVLVKIVTLNSFANKCPTYTC